MEQKLKAFLTITNIVTFKDLQKLIESQPNPIHTNAFQRVREKPFWI